MLTGSTISRTTTKPPRKGNVFNNEKNMRTSPQPATLFLKMFFRKSGPSQRSDLPIGRKIITKYAPMFYLWRAMAAGAYGGW